MLPRGLLPGASRRSGSGYARPAADRAARPVEQAAPELTPNRRGDRRGAAPGSLRRTGGSGDSDRLLLLALDALFLRPGSGPDAFRSGARWHRLAGRRRGLRGSGGVRDLGAAQAAAASLAGARCGSRPGRRGDRERHGPPESWHRCGPHPRQACRPARTTAGGGHRDDRGAGPALAWHGPVDAPPAVAARISRCDRPSHRDALARRTGRRRSC